MKLPRNFSPLTKNSTREWVYFIWADSPINLIKIGRASNLQKRMDSLETMNAAKVSFLTAFNAPKRTEALFHSLFSEHRAHGEWFRPGESLLSFLERDDLPEMLVLKDLSALFRELGAGKALDFAGITRAVFRSEVDRAREMCEAMAHDRRGTAKFLLSEQSLRPLGKL